MVESLKTPFAEVESSHDVGAFFRECQSAPLSLQSFTRTGSGVAIHEIGSQLEQFEKELQTKTVLMGFGLDSDAIHSPNEHYGIFNYFKGIETIPQFFKHFAALNQ